MGIFDKIKEVKVSRDSNLPKPGHYIVQIGKIRNAHSENTRKDFTCVDMEVLHSFPNEQQDEKGVRFTPNRAGESMTYLMGVQGLYYLQDFKSFVVGSMGVSADDVTPEHCEEVIGTKEPLNGCIVEVKVTYKAPRANRKVPGTMTKPFTGTNFIRPVPAAELLEVITPSIKDRYFSDGALEKWVAEEAKNAA